MPSQPYYRTIVSKTIPVSVESNEYYEHLREFRDLAIEESNWYGKRRNIGGLAFGNVTAGWSAQDGGIANLKHTGIRFRGSNITRLMPTTLRIIKTIDDGAQEVTSFSMDLDEMGWVDVHKYSYINGGMLEIASAGISKLLDQKNGLQHPNDTQKELIYTELERGASGDYAIYKTRQY